MDTMSKEKNCPDKDALHKVLAQAYKGKNFAILGIKLPPIHELLPAIPLRDSFIDTGDVEKAESVFDFGCLTLHPEQVFLSRMDGNAELESIRQKIHFGIVLTDDELMKLMVLPLSVPGTEGKQRMLERIVDLAEQIPDEGQRIFTLSGVIVASDKFINREYLDQIRRRISMTQLGQLYEKEKIEYANQKVRENDLKRAKSLLNEGIDIVKIMKTYGFTEEELLHLQDENVTV